MPDAIELLSIRSSFKAVDLKTPGPSAAEIDKLLTIACRVPAQPFIAGTSTPQ